MPCYLKVAINKKNENSYTAQLVKKRKEANFINYGTFTTQQNCCRMAGNLCQEIARMINL
jgi:hypothetical protein